jgi:predicted TIM-barrel fold metal-dependent hydrolase
MLIIDSHAHVFNSAVIENVAKKKEMSARLSLQTDEGPARAGLEALENEIRSSEVHCSIVLPTANAENIEKTNSSFIDIAGSSERIHTAGTLHPGYNRNRDELHRLYEHGIRGIKLCSFSQGFALHDPETISLFDTIKEENLEGYQFYVVMDTFYDASEYFGTDPANNTTPALFADLVRNYPDINFIGAHMGGLNAPFNEISEHIKSMDNLYLDTSNAAHTLENSEFVRLLKQHGPEHIIFGTDWPWFGYQPEIELIGNMSKFAGYNETQQQDVFSGNIARIAGISIDD